MNRIGKFKKDKFKIKEIIKVGSAEELDFVIEKGSQRIFVNSNQSGNKDNRFKVDDYWEGHLQADFGYVPVKKIDTKEKSIETNDRGGVLNFKGKVIHSDNNHVVVDCGFFINIIESNLKVGDYVSVDKPTMWMYNLEPVTK